MDYAGWSTNKSIIKLYLSDQKNATQLDNRMPARPAGCAGAGCWRGVPVPGADGQLTTFVFNFEMA
jgi:hypothetical protein